MGEVLITVLVVILIYLIATYPWILIAALGVLIALVVYFIKNPKHPGPSAGSYPNPPSSDGGQEWTSSSGEGFLYSGNMASGPVAATYRGGRIVEGYDSGLGPSVIRASYQNGYVYDGAVTGCMGTVLGRYEDGKLYRGNSTAYEDLIGRYGNGTVYGGNGSGWDEPVVGKYTGDEEGGAAAAIACLFQ